MRPVLFALLLLLALCGVTATACGGTSQPFAFENATSSEITIRVNDRLRLLIQPGETKSFNTPNNKGARRVIATDAQGKVRLDKVFSWEELEAAGFRLKIE